MARLIYIEDERAVRENYTELFREAGHEVEAFAQPPDLRAVVASAPPDLFILDVGLASDPDAGYELCSKIIEHEISAKVMFLTMRTQPHERARGFEAGAVEYLGKDLPFAEILNAIRRALEQR